MATEQSTIEGYFRMTKQFQSDLSLLGVSMYKIIPSRFILSESYFDIDDEISRKDNTVDYNTVRAAQWKYDDTNNWYNTWKPLLDNSGMSTIDLIGTNTSNGFTYSEIYITANPADIYLPEANVNWQKGNNIADNAPVLEMKKKRASGNFEFNHILLLYDVESQETNSVIAKDMIAGVYSLYNTQHIAIDNTLTYGEGQSWTARIATRVVNNSTGQASLEKNYDLPTTLLSALGDVITEIQNVQSTAQININTIKSYLSAFKEQKEVNVPYLSSDSKYWLVNGRPVGVNGEGGTIHDWWDEITPKEVDSILKDGGEAIDDDIVGKNWWDEITPAEVDSILDEK